MKTKQLTPQKGQQPPNKNKTARPLREKRLDVNNPDGRNDMPTAPLHSHSHPPEPPRTSETGQQEEGGRGGFLSTNPRKRRDKTREGKGKEVNIQAPRSKANHPGPRSTMDLDPGVEVQLTCGPK